MGIDTVFYGKIELNIEEIYDVNEDFDMDNLWETFKKNVNKTTDICWELDSDNYFVASENYRAPPEFYVRGFISIYNNFLQPNGINVYDSSITWNCCTCGIMLSGVILVTNEYIKLVIVCHDGDVKSTIYEYSGTQRKECSMELGNLTKIICDRDQEIDQLKKQITKLETEIKYLQEGIEHFDEKNI